MLNKQPDEALKYIQKIEDKLRFGKSGVNQLNDLGKDIKNTKLK